MKEPVISKERKTGNKKLSHPSICSKINLYVSRKLQSQLILFGKIEIEHLNNRLPES